MKNPQEYGILSGVWLFSAGSSRSRKLCFNQAEQESCEVGKVKINLR